MPSVKQRGIKYHFLSLWYDSRAIGEYSNDHANIRYKSYIHVYNFLICLQNCLFLGCPSIILSKNENTQKAIGVINDAF